MPESAGAKPVAPVRGARVGGQLGGGPVFVLEDLLQTDEPIWAVRDLVREAFGAETAAEGNLETVPYLSGALATGALHRLRGTTIDGRPWSLFCKVLQHVRHWPMLPLMPPEIAADLVNVPWRTELELWSPLIMKTLPDELRTPRLYRLVELPEDRVAVWQEDVIVSAAPFGFEHFTRAAYLLGRWNARSGTPEHLSTGPANGGLREYVTRALPMRGLQPLTDDELWGHPWLRGHAELRRLLRRLADRIPEILDRMDQLPLCLPHGDASPQNLLVPEAEPDSFVVIDINFHTPHAFGFDLGQLLVGLIHAGEMPASALPAIADQIVPSYLEGLRAEGLLLPVADVHWTFAMSALLRSGFDSFLYALMDDPSPAALATFDERVELCRFLAEQAAAALDTH